MNFEFDLWGWYTGQVEEPGLRTTPVAPANTSLTEVEGESRANWTGVEWVELPYVAPPAPVEPEADPRLWWVDVGPFKDRFDTHGYPGLKLTVLAMCRTNDICYGVFADLQGRLYIDLKGRRAELLTALGLIAQELTTAGKPAFTLAMRTALLDTPTNEAERYIKGLEG